MSNKEKAINENEVSKDIAESKVEATKEGDEPERKSEKDEIVKTVAGINTKAGEDAEVDTEDNLELHDLKRFERMKAKQNRLKKQMENMSKSEKFSYIFFYYKWKFLAAFIILFCIIAASVTIYKNTRPVAISYAVVNCENPSDINTDFVDDYKSFYNMEGSYQVNFGLDLHLDKETYLQEYQQNTDASDYTEFPMMCYNGYYDIVITDETGAIYCGMQDIFNPLNSYLGSDIYDQVEDRLFETEGFNKNFAPYAIDISDTDFAKSLNLGYDDVYIGLPGTTERNYNNAMKMLKYILGIDIQSIE